MSTFTSTVPGAVTTLYGYMTAVAAASTVLDVQAYVGLQLTPSPNFMMIGDAETGLLVTPVDSEWASMGAAAKRRTERYALQGCIKCWAGGIDWQSRLNDVTSLLDALQEQILSDPGGNGTLTPSGSWGAFNWRMEANGPLGDPAGWGVLLGFELQVINAQIVG